MPSAPAPWGLVHTLSTHVQTLLAPHSTIHISMVHPVAPIQLTLPPNTRVPSCYFMLCRGGPYARIVVLAELKTPQMLAANTEGSGFAIRDDQINNFILYQLQKGWCFCSKWIVGRSETHRGPLYSLLMTINCRIQSAPC